MRTATTRLAVAATLTVSCGGNVGEPTALESMPREPRWSAPEKIDSTGRDDHDPRLAVAAGGEAVAVWNHDVVGGRGFRFSDGLRASRYTPAKGWTPSLPIPDTRNRGAFAVTLDDGGAAVVLLSAALDEPRRVWASRAAPASGWSAPETVQEGGGNAYQARVVQLLPGLTLAGWSEFDRTRTTLWSRSRDDRGWRRTQPIDVSGTAINSFDLVTTGRGQALATWYEATGPGTGDIFANLFDAEDGWRGAGLIGSGLFPVSGFDASGRVLVVWNTSDGLRMNRFLPGSGWTGEASGPGGRGRSTWGVRLAVGASGRALAAWREQNQRAATELWAALYDPLTGWSPDRQLSATGPSEAQVVIDAAGRGVVVWDEDAFVIAQTYLPATGWGRQERVGGGSRALAGIDAQGNVTVVWPGDGIQFSRLALGR